MPGSKQRDREGGSTVRNLDENNLLAPFDRVFGSTLRVFQRIRLAKV